MKAYRCKRCGRKYRTDAVLDERGICIRCVVIENNGNKHL